VGGKWLEHVNARSVLCDFIGLSISPISGQRGGRRREEKRRRRKEETRGEEYACGLTRPVPPMDDNDTCPSAHTLSAHSARRTARCSILLLSWRARGWRQQMRENNTPSSAFKWPALGSIFATTWCMVAVVVDVVVDGEDGVGDGAATRVD
jgi:hypothetical protein